MPAKGWRKHPAGYKPPRKSPGKHKDPQYHRKWMLRVQYGITVEEFDKLLSQQQGGCGICRTTTPGGKMGRFHVDHDHATGKVRGLLCQRCNMACGLLQDSHTVALMASHYLRRGGWKLWP